MSDQYNASNQPNYAPGIRQTSQSDSTTKVMAAPTYNQNIGFGPAFLVMLVFLVVAIMASTLSNVNRDAPAGQDVGSISSEGVSATSLS